MKKILVIGSKGMAGHVVLQSLPQLGEYEVYGVARNIEPTDRLFNLDVSDTVGLKKLIDLEFDVIVNCIGILNKDAEDNPHKAIWFNSYFPHLLESLTKNTKTKVISISTDCVFSGKRGGYSENDFKDGIGFYAQSKALGEIVNDKDCTIRTSIIGPEINQEGIGLFHWFMQQNNEISGYSQAFWSGITTIELAKVIHQTIQQNIAGLIIVAGVEKIDKFSLLKIFNKVFKNDKLIISENPSYKVDKSMHSIRMDFNYKVPTYEEMILEMKSWINTNSYNY
ncbi:sugar nucleotide-binding protein [Flavobacterium cellulosilyticum]|uniref:NAD-dependent epimerase/dehydratase family protein n=1 Tax=Flavobacterium cellulosilyticum TaxID=2541731 RepID=A0A4R5CLM4_9FLAO|nr:sugar nucleotide-binding protein [Flavobacterium cellulosilyticum]TDD98364.1 NAD-dependent epimerase/dehydratase family protein [Flavobacterium cellulosilyticum]